MVDKVSNVSAGVDSGRQASAASGAGGGHKDDKSEPPRKNPSRVKKSRHAKRCYICNKTGHLKKNCPIQEAYRTLLDRIEQEQQQQQEQHAAPGQPRGLPLRSGHRPNRRGQRRASLWQQRGQEDVAPPRENHTDASDENGAEQQQDQQQKGQ